jgi:hypothetical protein
MRPTKSNDIFRVRAVLTLLEAGLHTIPVYGPGHPTYEQGMEKVGMGFAGLWERLTGLQLRSKKKVGVWRMNRFPS